MTFANSNVPLCHKLILVTGPSRSGKSEWAEQLAAHSNRKVTYVATAYIDPDDRDWQARIAQHQQRRPSDWTTQEVPRALSATIRAATVADCLLIDSLGTWVTNLLEKDEAAWQAVVEDVLLSLSQTKATVILVAEETGWGVVPAYPIGRLFRDRLGQLTRQLGAIADPVYLVTGGHVLNLSNLGTPLSQSSQMLNGSSETCS